MNKITTKAKQQSNYQVINWLKEIDIRGNC